MTMQPISDTDDARARAERIRKGVTALAEWRRDVIDAWLRRDDQVLGYDSWISYVHGEFDVLPRLAKPERDALMILLSDARMPQREIGATVGVDQKTVSNAGRSALRKSPQATYTDADNRAGDFENGCYVDPRGGLPALKQTVRDADRWLAPYFVDPAPHQIDVIQKWLDRLQRKISRARTEIGND